MVYEIIPIQLGSIKSFYSLIQPIFFFTAQVESSETDGKDLPPTHTTNKWTKVEPAIRGDISKGRGDHLPVPDFFQGITLKVTLTIHRNLMVCLLSRG